jgi:hypothetical protein
VSPLAAACHRCGRWTPEVTVTWIRIPYLAGVDRFRVGDYPVALCTECQKDGWQPIDYSRGRIHWREPATKARSN